MTKKSLENETCADLTKKSLENETCADLTKKSLENETCAKGSCAPVNAVSKEGILSLILIFTVLAILFLIAYVLNGYSLNF